MLWKVSMFPFISSYSLVKGSCVNYAFFDFLAVFFSLTYLKGRYTHTHIHTHTGGGLLHDQPISHGPHHTHTQVEGFFMINQYHMALINDNDFGLDGNDS
jgi:hypothetical protein